MKKLTILIVAFIMLCLSSCEKLERCKTCTTRSTYPNSEFTFVACGKELRDVDGEYRTYKTIINGSLVNVEISTTCR
jgi:hypothetical protein